MLDYVAWSAPVKDLKNWRYEGVIYRRKQDPEAVASDKPRYITNIYRGVRIVYRYFDFRGERLLSVTVRGDAAGELSVSAGRKRLGTFLIEPSRDWTQYSMKVSAEGADSLVFSCRGEGGLSFCSFSLPGLRSKFWTRGEYDGTER